MPKKNVNTEAMSFNLSGVLDADNLTVENDGVFYSLKDKLKNFDGCTIEINCATVVDIHPMQQE